jgi:hypothetical protein
MVTTVYEGARVCAFPVTVFEGNRDTGVVAGGKRREMETLIVWNIKKKLDIKIELQCLSRYLK